jgi:hypothetical protein
MREHPLSLPQVYRWLESVRGSAPNWDVTTAAIPPSTSNLTAAAQAATSRMLNASAPTSFSRSFPFYLDPATHLGFEKSEMKQFLTASVWSLSHGNMVTDPQVKREDDTLDEGREVCQRRDDDDLRFLTCIFLRSFMLWF